MNFSIENRINILLEISKFINSFFEKNLDSETLINFENLIKTEQNHNYWFTEDNVIYALKHWAETLTLDNIKKWLEPYSSAIETCENKVVAIIAAGNIPMVCFHDILCSFITGHTTKIKLSKKDSRLIKYIFNHIFLKYPELSNKIILLEDEPLKKFDAIIATGSNNTIKYFEYYFGKYPHIFRHNRNSIAILTGDETFQELESLSDDVFLYFGLGCRNVSKIYIPENYNFNNLICAFDKWNKVFYNHHYINNYDYHKAIYIINKEKFLDTGFLLLKESDKISSPVGVLFYEFYNNLEVLIQKLQLEKNNIQCIVSKKNVLFLPTSLPGTTQKPELWEYADNIDTIKFLLNI